MPRDYENLVDPMPFRMWLQNKVQEIGIGNVASAVGVDPRRIDALIYMRPHARRIKSGEIRVYTQKHVSLATVHEYMAAFGEHEYDIYHPDTGSAQLPLFSVIEGGRESETTYVSARETA